MKHWSTQLDAMGACSDAVAWARTQPSLAAAWRTCKRGDWMLWLAGRRIGTSGSRAHRRVVLAAAKCARLALPIWTAEHPDDDRPRLAIVAAERWARIPTDENKTAASDVAYVAGTCSAAAFAAAAFAAAASAAAASATTFAASAAAAASDASAATHKRSLARSAAIVRRIIPVAPRAKRAAQRKKR